MKIIVFLILISFSQLQANVFGQSVSISQKKIHIVDVFRNVKEQTGFTIICNSNVIKNIPAQQINLKNVPIEIALKKILYPIGLDYIIKDKAIIVKKKSKVNEILIEEDKTLTLQQRQITGRVVNKSGLTLTGVTIALKGKETIGTSTDRNGSFVLNIPSSKVVLLISFQGYITKELEVEKEENNITVQLEEDTKGLEEIVVVGFGLQKKTNLVGSQSTLKPEELKLPVRSISTALAGRLSGIVSVQRSGAPGYDNADLLIRGVSTFASSPQGPLIVIDGVPGRTMNNIDPEDVESFTVLKDATATAVYGTRGANGVMLIETKKGKTGRPVINVELNKSITRFTQLPDFVDAPTYMRLYNEGLVTRGRSAAFQDNIIEKHISQEDPDLYPNVNWFDELFNRTGANERINLNVRGGATNARYYVAAGYFGENGMFKKDDIETYNSSLKFNRFNFLSNVDVDVTNTTKLQVGISGAIENNNYGGTSIGSIFQAATLTPPHLIPTIYSNGLAPQVIGGGGASVSPYIMMTKYGYTTQFNSSVRSNINLTQDLGFITSGLSVKTLFSYDSYNFNRIARTKEPQTYFADGRDEDGNLLTSIIKNSADVLGFSASRGGNRNFYTETAINYVNKFGLHDISGMLLYNQSDYVDANASSVIESIPFRLRGLTGRATYGYNNKYFLEGNFGYTGSENFAPDNRYGFFPSVGMGWMVSNESFFEPLKDIFSLLKLRYTYGLSGNSNTNSRFLFLTTINSGPGYTFGAPESRSKNTGGLEEGIAGSDVTWETAYKQNLGVEMNFLDDELQLIVELFNENRKGILLKDQTLPNASGLTLTNLPYSNVGETKNKGIDLTLTYNKQFNDNTFITLRGSFNYNKNLNVHDGLPPWAYPWLNRSGNRISQRFGLISEGFFTSNEEIQSSAEQTGDVRVGDLKYKDMNGDGIIDSYDQNAIGFGPIPSILYGLNLGFGIKNFDLNVFFQGAGQVDFLYAAGESTEPFKGGASVGNLYSIVSDRWTEENPNPNAFYPRLSTNQDLTSNYQVSSHWIHRSDYLRIKSAEIGYNFKAEFLKKIHANKMRMFINGTNLLTFSKWKIWDPELGDGRGTEYPNISAYNLGFRLTLQ